jgi:hypothetical protein
MAVTNENYIPQKIRGRLNLGIACYHLVQNLSISYLKNVLIKIYKATILPIVLYGCEIWSLTLKEEYRLMLFEYGVLRRILIPNRE